MSGACQMSPELGSIRAVLGAVDCNTQDFAQRGYLALAGSPAFQTSVTIALTIYVAAVGYRLLLAPDGARLSDGPRMALKVGAILAMVTSWSLFQTLVFDVASKAPGQLAVLISSPSVGGVQGVSDPVGQLQVLYDQLSAASGAFAGAMKTPGAARFGAAALSLASAADTVLVVTAGMLAACTLLIGVLTAVGPLFVALFLFDATRGLAVGWVRALAATAVSTLLIWTLVFLEFASLTPWLVTLAQQAQTGSLNANTAVSASTLVFVFTLGQVAMVLAAIMIAVALNPPKILAERSSAREQVVVGRQDAVAGLATGGPGFSSRAGILADRIRGEAAGRTELASTTRSPGPGRAQSSYSGSDQDYRRPSPGGARRGSREALQ
jgi:type IV secretion system protein VirB6